MSKPEIRAGPLPSSSWPTQNELDGNLEGFGGGAYNSLPSIKTPTGLLSIYYGF